LKTECVCGVQFVSSKLWQINAFISILTYSLKGLVTKLKSSYSYLKNCKDTKSIF